MINLSVLVRKNECVHLPFTHLSPVLEARLGVVEDKTQTLRGVRADRYAWFRRHAKPVRLC